MHEDIENLINQKYEEIMDRDHSAMYYDLNVQKVLFIIKVKEAMTL